MSDEPVFRFVGRATGSDPTGYYHPRWDRAEPISVLASTRSEATSKAFALLGIHNRFGREGFGGRPDTPGWALKWERVTEEARTSLLSREQVHRAIVSAGFNISARLSDGDVTSLWGALNEEITA